MRTKITFSSECEEEFFSGVYIAISGINRNIIRDRFGCPFWGFDMDSLVETLEKNEYHSYGTVLVHNDETEKDYKLYKKFAFQFR